MSIHPTAVVDAKAQLGHQVTVGPFSVVGENVQLGDGCTVGSHCLLGETNHRNQGQDLIIGAFSTIRSHSVFYLGSSFQDGLVTGHSVTVREGTRAGLNLQIGTLSDIQGDCTFGNYVRLHSSCFISQGSVVNDFVWLFPNVALLNDPHPPSAVLLGVTIGLRAAVGAGAVILPGVNVAADCVIGAGSVVTRNVASGVVVRGNPAKEYGPADRIKRRDAPGSPAYPWVKHFQRGIPAEVTAEWL